MKLDDISHWNEDAVLPDSLPILWILGDEPIIGLCLY